MNRRRFIAMGAGSGAAALVAGGGWASARGAAGPGAAGSRIQHSIVHWCFGENGEKWDIERMCRVARQLGCRSIELIPYACYPVLKRFGLVCAITQIDMGSDPPFVKGFNDPHHWPRVMKATRDAIDLAAANGSPSVICFTGFGARDPENPDSPRVSKEEGARNCVAGLKQVVGYAEQKKVTLCLEILNSRATDHPMKGHAGYQGDHADYCIEIIRQVGSPRLKLLFDIYHVQVMDGDVIRRIREYRDLIGHVHTAGNPGRNELDDRQEIHFPPIMRALVDAGYRGYVGHEFIPTGDPYQGLRKAIRTCDV
ncbi:MAG TPA: TIM barrel protein [Candidatus Paceibacterota bacterium]|nr:TIM barrel protein [Verrucomicrobiota bacterium]HRZ45207.1 TIM barrel protein [Candidatus Paceibacterota bacterium]HRZ94612.1 TIM barrel protein [Candidatus Paceibacterota bacterium]